MRRATVVLIAITFCLPAQTKRDTYRNAFRVWREAEPNLERDAATSGEKLAAAASRAAAPASAYSAARSTFLRDWASQAGPDLSALQTGAPDNIPDLAPSADYMRLVNAQSTLLNGSMANFANYPDRFIQQLLQAMQRERDALDALGGAVRDRQKTQEKLAQSADAISQARAKIMELQNGNSNLADSAGAMEKEAALWASYYQKLTDGARGAAAPLTTAIPQPAPATSIAVAEPPVVTAPSPAAGVAAAPPAAAVAAPPPSASPARALPALPLLRYTGGWTYPTVNGLFHGAEPEFVDLVVHEENGRATGTFYGRFKLPRGSAGDPVLRFDFSGDFRAGRNQTFTLETGDGAKGTIELIPGNAFNLLEVNFQTEPKEGKIQRADVVLVKK